MRPRRGLVLGAVLFAAYLRDRFPPAKPPAELAVLPPATGRPARAPQTTQATVQGSCPHNKSPVSNLPRPAAGF